MVSLTLFFRKLAHFTLLTFLLLVPFLAQAQERIITVGIPNVHPLAFYDQEQGFTGVYPDLLNIIAAKEGWKIQYVEGFWPELLSKLERGDIDIMTCVAISDEREKIFAFPTEKVATSWGQVFVGKLMDVESILGMEEKQVQLVQNDINGMHFRELCLRFGVRCHYSYSINFEQASEAVSNGNADAVVIPSILSGPLVQKYQIHPTSIMFEPVTTLLASTKNKNQEILQTIDSYLKKWKQDSNAPYHATIDTWLYPASKPPLLTQRQVLLTTAIALVCAFMLFLWLWLLRKQVRSRTHELYVAHEAMADP